MSTPIHIAHPFATRFYGGKANGAMIEISDSYGNAVVGKYTEVVAMAKAIVEFDEWDGVKPTTP